MPEQKLTVEMLAKQLDDRMSLFERNLATLSTRLEERKGGVNIQQLIQQRKMEAEADVTVTSGGGGGITDVEVRYTRGTKVLDYRVQRGGTWGAYVTVETAVAH